MTRAKEITPEIITSTVTNVVTTDKFEYTLEGSDIVTHTNFLIKIINNFNEEGEYSIDDVKVTVKSL